jgi:hypothetical protein
MKSDRASPASKHRQRKKIEASTRPTAFLQLVVNQAKSGNSRSDAHLASGATEAPPRFERDESKTSSAVGDLQDHIRRFCEGFFSPGNRSLF